MDRIFGSLSIKKNKKKSNTRNQPGETNASVPASDFEPEQQARPVRKSVDWTTVKYHPKDLPPPLHGVEPPEWLNGSEETRQLKTAFQAPARATAGARRIESFVRYMHRTHFDSWINIDSLLKMGTWEADAKSLRPTPSGHLATLSKTLSFLEEAEGRSHQSSTLHLFITLAEKSKLYDIISYNGHPLDSAACNSGRTAVRQCYYNGVRVVGISREFMAF
ncbi:hypothetical protein GYMLUDRAFT_63186 [Collybiopsis luxurians FD-317 M1]|uniref:Uncharacterized protein n=1 Tax=Collybiopsis luxurians FD-317 M1 TaxID=944289 RepID=A0A0D0BX85_9AGAR|nr:hypothetical protein GYMLUDRAFT_63186 [Collybiopsis luxurians FD-317 M1]